MPSQYQNFGVSFLYPENWKVTDESHESPLGVTLETPDGGYWELQIYEPIVEPAMLVDHVLEAMENEYDDLEAHEAAERWDDLPAIGYDMHFFCLDLLVLSNVRACIVGERSYLLLCQAESREFDKQAPVFAAITKSLLS